MQLRLTLVGGDASTEPVLVEAAPGDTVGDLVSLLVQEGRVPAGARLEVDGSALAATDPIGLPPLLDGVVVRVRAGGGRAVRLVRGGRAGGAAPASPIRLEVVGGPDAGAVLPLSPGRHRIGRDPDCELSVADAHLSRVHAEVEVTAAGITVTDVSSTNGLARISPGGELTAFATGHLTVGDHLRLGTTTLAVRAGLARPLSGRPAGDGTVAVARTSGRGSGWAPVTLVRPAPSAEPARPRFPWVQVLLPLPVCAVLAWLWGPQLLVFALLGPLLAGGSAISDRLGAGRSARAQAAQHATAVAAHESARREAVAAERAHLLTLHPDPATVVTVATTPTTRLWERTATALGGLAVRLGTSTIRGASAETGPTGVRECLMLAEAPVNLDLAAVGSLGIDGHADLVRRSGAWVVTQLATLVAPGSLSVDVVGDDDDEEWAWVRLLPHAGDGSADVVAALRSRLGERGDRTRPADPRDRAAVVLVLDARLVGRLPGLADLLADGPARGVHVVVLDPAGHGLPAGLGAVLHVRHDPSATHLSMGGDSRGARAVAAADTHGGVVEGSALVPDGLSRGRAEVAARALAPLRDEHAGVDPTLPTRLALSELLGSPTPHDVLETWQARRGPVAVVGADASGPTTVDLRRDGPHALVGGTTGAGKSELLRTLVAALALGSAPEDLAFVLVDYKGGAAFGDLADLPHVAAVVTDLDAELVERALVSLTAELRRRERVLATTGAADLDEHLARGGERLPRLVIVVDELRALVDELPAFVQGLVRIASLGRSLGVHLVLATQRPAGVVSADIAANVNLRVALRVRDRVDSEAIVGTPHAAALPASTPGRAIASVAGAETTFQSALVTPDECPEPPLSVRAGDWVATGAPRPVPGPRPSGVTELVRAAALAGGHAPAPPPWRPQLPETLPWTPAAQDAFVSLGLVDLPEQQRTDVLEWDPRSDGHLAILGASRSGRTTALLTVVGAVLAADAPWQVHVLQATNALSGLSRARSVGSVVSLHDRELVGRFVERLEAEVASRREASGPSLPSLMIAIDGWDVLAGQVTDLAGHELVERLLAVLRDGPAVGVHAAATGGRALVQGRTGERFPRRIALGSLDAAEALHLGLPFTRGGGARPPGRGTDVRSGALVHLARHGAGAGVEDDVLAVVAIDRRRARIGPGPAPFRVEPLPERVDASCLRGQAGAIGLGADLEPVGFRPTDLHVLVVGPRGSGRSTALRALARAWRAQGLAVVLVAERTVDGVGCLTADRALDLADRLRQEPRTALLVDDVDHHADTALEALVLEAVATAARRGAPVAVSADGAALVTAFRGAAVQVAARRTGLLLAPRGAADGDVLGVRVRAPRGGPPGRGLIVRDGVAEVVQVVTDEPDPSTRVHEPPRAALR